MNEPESIWPLQSWAIGEVLASLVGGPPAPSPAVVTPFSRRWQSAANGASEPLLSSSAS